jgi:hypothetical protein
MVLLPAAALSAATAAGEIVYMEGDVKVYRDGEALPDYRVDVGFAVEEFDMIETGSRGFVELSLNYGNGGSLQVKPGTSFYFEVEDTSTEPKSDVHMMAGSMAYRVGKLSGNSAFNVKTESVAMGVRGTSFDATVSPDGGILVTCEEGLVACTNDAGAEQYSRPGRVVENLPNEGLSTAEVPVESLEAYKESWVSAREEVFKSGASTFIRAYARRYLDFLPRFRDAYEELITYEQQLRSAASESANLGMLFRLKSRVSPAVVRMRSIMPLFDDLFFRLQTLEEYHSRGIGRGMIEGELSTGSFFRRFNRERRDLKQSISKTYFLFKLYSVLHEKTGGGPSITDDPFGDDPFGGGFSPSGPPQGGMPDSMMDDF